MNGEEMLAEAMAAIRWEAALELVRAIDAIVLLEQIERVRPGWFPITLTDRQRVSDARKRWIGVRA